jgi:hypothetical protein
MTYLRAVPLCPLFLIALVAACPPAPGDDSSTSASSSTASSSSGSESASGTEPTSQPTTEPTTVATDESASGTESASGSTTGTTAPDTSSTGDTDDTTTGALACNELPDFVASFTAWEAARDANANTYYYSVLRGVGGLMPPDYCIYRTLVAVADGKVVERRVEISDQIGNPMCDEPFVEKDAEVGTKMSDFAAPAVTVDALYGACCDMVLHIEPADEYTITFTTDEDGLMQACYYVANGCADGCDGGPLGAALEFEVLEFGAPPPQP